MNDCLPVAVNTSEISSLLIRLGAVSNHVGLVQTSYGVYLAIQNPDKLMLVTKWLYPEIAKNFGCTTYAVERNIRTVVNKIWETNPQCLCDLAGGSLVQRPTASNLLTILTFYFRSSQ